MWKMATWKRKTPKKSNIAAMVSTFMTSVCALRTNNMRRLPLQTEWHKHACNDTLRARAREGWRWRWRIRKITRAQHSNHNKMMTKGTRKPHGNSKWGALCSTTRSFSKPFEIPWNISCDSYSSSNTITTQIKWDEKEKTFVLIYFSLVFFFFFLFVTCP